MHTSNTAAAHAQTAVNVAAGIAVAVVIARWISTKMRPAGDSLSAKVPNRVRVTLPLSNKPSDMTAAQWTLPALSCRRIGQPHQTEAEGKGLY